MHRFFLISALICSTFSSAASAGLFVTVPFTLLCFLSWFIFGIAHVVYVLFRSLISGVVHCDYGSQIANGSYFFPGVSGFFVIFYL